MQTLPASLRCIRAACASWGGLTALGLYPTAAAAASALARMPSSWGVLASLQRSVASSTSGGGGGSSSSASRNLAWLPGTSHAAPTRSAEESFKAASQAELDVLTGLGLNQVAAEAVRKAWYSGRIKQLSTSTGAAALQSGKYADPVSAKRVLAALRRLLKAHKAAAAAAAAPSPAAQPEPQQKQRARSKRRAAARGSTDVGTLAGSAHQAAAAGMAGAAESRQLDWGAVDIQAILTADPRILMVPVGDLAQRLRSLLNGLAGVLGLDLALRYVHKSRRLRSMLADAAAEVQRVQERSSAYADVLGVQPRVGLLAASESSHVAHLTQQKFKEKLQHFADKWGVETTHGAMTQPHLLSSSTDTLDSNSQKLQQLLGCTDAQLQRTIRKAPRVLSTKTGHIAAHLTDLIKLLQPLGMDAADVRKLVLKQPMLLLANPVILASKLERLKELLGPSAHKLRNTICQQPTLLGSKSETLAAHMEGLQQLLDCDSSTVCKVVSRSPTLAASDLGALADRLQELSQVLEMPLAEVKALCCREAVLLTLTPELVGSKLQLWSDALGVQRLEILKAVKAYPKFVTFDSAAVSAHMELLQALVLRSELWRAGRSFAKTPGSGSRQTPTRGRVVKCTWPLQFSRSLSGRLPLRLEYLLATGLQEQVTLSQADKTSEAAWASQFPDFQDWVGLRLQHLQKDAASEWPPVLLEKAVNWYAAWTSGQQGRRRAVTKQAASAAQGSGPAAAARGAAAAAAAAERSRLETDRTRQDGPAEGDAAGRSRHDRRSCDMTAAGAVYNSSGMLDGALQHCAHTS